MHRFKELNVWKKSVDVAVEVYSLTKKFPADERYGLIAQINRCAVSVASNIAEGAGRNTNGEFRHFLGISMGSSFELETQLIIAQKVEFLNPEDADAVIKKLNEIQDMNSGLQRSL
jgi:four helix bundle protein